MSYDKATCRVRFGINVGSGSQEGEWVTTRLTQLPRVRKPLGASGETEGPEFGLPQSSVLVLAHPLVMSEPRKAAPTVPRTWRVECPLLQTQRQI